VAESTTFPGRTVSWPQPQDLGSLIQKLVNIAVITDRICTNACACYLATSNAPLTFFFTKDRLVLEI